MRRERQKVQNPDETYSEAFEDENLDPNVYFSKVKRGRTLSMNNETKDQSSTRFNTSFFSEDFVPIEDNP